MISVIKEKTDLDEIRFLKRQLRRTAALHREIKQLLEAEYYAGKHFQTKDLAKLTLRKTNCTNRLAHLVRSVNDLISQMADRPAGQTLEDRVRALPGLTRDQASGLGPLAKTVERGHREIMDMARRNVSLFKTFRDRLWAVSRYARPGDGV